MKSEIIELQNRAILELVTKSKHMDEVTFRAPTGSGKTFMMAKFMDKILEEDNDVVFLVSTLSKGGLAKQNHDKFLEYLQKGFVKNINPYLINSDINGEERLFIPTGYNVYSLPRDLYKAGGRLMQGSMESFLQEMTSHFDFSGVEISMGLNKKVYLIRDESHQATHNLDTLASTYFTKVFNFSATPKLQKRQEIDVKITDEEAESIGLIKKVVPGLNMDSFEDAVRLFKEKKNDYNRCLKVHPCMIVQISNKEKAEEEWNTIIKPVLDKNQDLKWMLIVDKLKDCDTNDVYKKKKVPLFKWKEYAKNNQDTTDIIIFKLAISEGWDIPRACMLYQIRDTDSKQLDEQVMGRVRRNPRLMDFETLSTEAQTLATTSWIWGVVPQQDKNVFEVNLADKKIVKEALRIKTTRLKSLKNRKEFNIENFVDEISDKVVYQDIFTLYKRLGSSNNMVKELSREYSNTVKKWFKFNENIDKIRKSCDDYYCDYAQSMIINSDEKGTPIMETLPNISYYIDTIEKLDINNWIWIKRDKTEEFAFDSEAEKKWAIILMQLCSENINKNSNDRVVKRLSEVADFNKYLWGKNYIDNSNIKFEYYMNGNHFSYPDFVLKDSYGRIHIFEVKSVNKSKNVDVDEEEYKNKIIQLRECYRQASVLTEQIFYLPIMSGNDWNIIQLKKGREKTLRKVQFIEDIKIDDENSIKMDLHNMVGKTLNKEQAAHIDIEKIKDAFKDR